MMSSSFNGSVSSARRLRWASRSDADTSVSTTSPKLGSVVLSTVEERPVRSSSAPALTSMWTSGGTPSGSHSGSSQVSLSRLCSLMVAETSVRSQRELSVTSQVAAAAHSKPFPQSMHSPPATPQAAFESPARQVSPEQHPSQLAGPHAASGGSPASTPALSPPSPGSSSPSDDPQAEAARTTA